MWKQNNSEGQTTTTLDNDNNKLSPVVLDSGFLSWETEDNSMKNYDMTISDQLSECMIRNLRLSNININNLETEKTQRCKDKHDQRLDIQSPDIDGADILKQPYEVFYSQNNNGDTQLHISIVLHYEEAALWLIGMAPHPCLLDILNDDRHTALHLAASTRQPRIIRRLLLAGANTRLRTRVGETPLHIACALGDVTSARALLQPFNLSESLSVPNIYREVRPMQANDLEIRNFVGETALHLAAKNGHSEVIVELIRAGADPDAQECLAGRTALHIAIENRHQHVIRRLAHEKRCNINAVTYAGKTPLHVALDVDLRLAEELLRLGATPCDTEMLSESSSEDDEGPF